MIDGAVASSEASADRLRKHGIEVFDLNSVNSMDIYVDGADEITEHMHMLKGGGGALTREKIVAAVAKTFICICDETKYVPVLGKFPLPVEVLPMAKSYVARELTKLGGQPQLRNFTTDNGNVILDVHGLVIKDPIAMEAAINQMVGVVTNGLFAARSISSDEIVVTSAMTLFFEIGVRVAVTKTSEVLSSLSAKTFAVKS